MTPAKDIADMLVSSGVGVFAAESGWSINVSREPVSPDTAITIYDTGGGPDVNVDINMRQPTIQVRVRGYDYPEAYAKHEEIRSALCIPTFRDQGDHRYVGVWMQSDILSIGRDDNDRHLLTANYRIERMPL